MATTTNTTEEKATVSPFAVIQTGGKQYTVAPGKTITIEKLDGEFNIGDKVTFGEVLLSDTGYQTKLGTPFIGGTKVVGEIAEIGRGKKVIIMRYKQKSRAGVPKNGHRQPFFKVKITSI